MGIYAGSEGSYKKWSKLYDPLIEDMHNWPPGGVHVNGMDASEIDFTFSPEEIKMISHIRIEIRRNLSQYELGPDLNKK